jgi:hypothetical protein
MRLRQSSNVKIRGGIRRESGGDKFMPCIGDLVDLLPLRWTSILLPTTSRWSTVLAVAAHFAKPFDNAGVAFLSLRRRGNKSSVSTKKSRFVFVSGGDGGD